MVGGEAGGTPACRNCGSTVVVPVVYGVPNALLAPSFLAGRIHAGGAMGRLADHSGSHWICRACGTSWRGGMFEGSGDSPDDPVVITGIDEHAVRIRAERMYLVERFGLPAELVAPGQTGWRELHQAAARMPGDRILDMITVGFPTGESRIIYFDLAGPRLSGADPAASPGLATDPAVSQDSGAVTKPRRTGLWRRRRSSPQPPVF